MRMTLHWKVCRSQDPGRLFLTEAVSVHTSTTLALISSDGIWWLIEMNTEAERLGGPLCSRRCPGCCRKSGISFVLSVLLLHARRDL